jgi:hypothetical protein
MEEGEVRKFGHDWLSRTAAWGFAAYGKSCRLGYIANMLWREGSSCGRPMNAPAAFKLIVAILLIAAVPVCAQAQNSRVSKDDAQRVVTIISGDKTKTQIYCDVLKLSQIAQAYEKNDRKMVDELSQKIDTLEKTLGPEYLALVDGLQDIDPESEVGQGD